MNKTGGSKKEQRGDHVEEDMLFTYSEEEKQANEINRENAKRVFSPKSISWYPWLGELGLSKTEALVYGFVDYYTSYGSGKFYFTDEQLGKVLQCSPKTISRSIKKLRDLELLKTGHKIRAGGGTIRFVTIESRLVQKVPFRMEQKVPLRVVQKVPTNKKYIKGNKINTLSKDNGTKSDKRDISVNRFIEGINNNLEYKLPNDGQARRYAHNSIQLLTRENANGEIKQGRDFLKKDVWENAEWFMGDYLVSKIERGFHPQKWGTLYDNLKLWVANEGKFPPDERRFK